MAYEFQVTVDSQRPHELADWWAETLGWVVEPQDEAFIRRMIAEGHATDADTMTYHGALVWRDGAAIRFPGEAEGRGPHPRVSSCPSPRRSRTGSTSICGARAAPTRESRR
jgi:hypothetical protein